MKTGKGPLKHDKELSKQKPAVPGEAVEYIYVPARGFMTGRVVKKGQVIRLIDLEGQQVPDIVIWDTNNLYNVLSVFITMSIICRWKLRIGDGLYSKNSEKLATLSDTTTDGAHDILWGSGCNEPLNRARYGIPGTVNCRDNLVAAMASYSLSARDIDGACIFNGFAAPVYKPDGTLETVPGAGKPGDYLDLMAEMDIIVAFSNCPQERNACNAYNPSPMMAVIFQPNERYKAKLMRAQSKLA